MSSSSDRPKNFDLIRIGLPRVAYSAGSTPGQEHEMRLLLSLLLMAVTASVHAAPLQKFTVRNAATRHAVCNDGSPAIYYFRPGTGTGVNRWVIFLGGGGFCYSVTACQLREILNPELMTSSDKP